MAKTDNTYPAWRRSLDIYKAWSESNITKADIARNFKVDPKTVGKAIALIGDLLYLNGTAWRFEDLEIAFVLVAKYASEKDVVKIVRAIVSNFKTLSEFLDYDGNLQKFPFVGPKYAMIMERVQTEPVLKDLFVRISYKAYVKLRTYSENRNISLGHALSVAVYNMTDW